MLGLTALGLASVVNAASAGDLLCQSDWVQPNVITTCGNFGWIIGEDSDNVGPTAINMVVNQDGYYCVARGIPEDPGVGDVGYLLHKGQGLQTGTLKDASLSQVSMSCYNYDPGPPDPPLPGGPDGPSPS